MVEVSQKNFTIEQFREYLLTHLLDEVLSCEMYQDDEQEYMIAIGSLMYDYYLIQIRSDARFFEDLDISHLPIKLIDKLLKIIHPH
ncbi:MAG: hypothetical protein ACTSQI_15120 [Candidatus Helarchaeota archaeon]